VDEPVVVCAYDSETDANLCGDDRGGFVTDAKNPTVDITCPLCRLRMEE
jgi:hypothetical protein